MPLMGSLVEHVCENNLRDFQTENAKRTKTERNKKRLSKDCEITTKGITYMKQKYQKEMKERKEQKKHLR